MDNRNQLVDILMEYGGHDIEAVVEARRSPKAITNKVLEVLAFAVAHDPETSTVLEALFQSKRAEYADFRRRAGLDR